jgi:hypothetical protein
VKRCARPGDGFLNEILGVLAVLCQLKRRPQQLRLIWQRIALEPFRKLRSHPVMDIPAHVFAPPVRRPPSTINHAGQTQPGST